MERWKIFTGSTAQQYDQWYSTLWGRFADAAQRRLFRSMARLSAGQKVLDVGCGTGRYLLWLSHLGAWAVGADISPDMLAIAANRLRGHGVPVRLLRADGARLPFKPRIFELAICVTTLEFVSDPAAVVSEMGRVADSVFVGVLNRRSRLYRQQRARSGPLSLAHWFTPDELASVMRQALPAWQVELKSCLLWGRFGSLPGALMARLAELLLPLAPLSGGFVAAYAMRPGRSV